MILQKYPCGPLETNAILVACETTLRAAIVDPSPGSANILLKEMERRRLQLKAIFLTHSHWDHFADVHTLKETTGVPVFVHALDAPNVIRPGADGLPLCLPIKGVQPDGYLEDHMSLELGAMTFEVIHTPGHSPGGVCFYFREQQILISGDTLFCGCMGRIDLPTGEPNQMWESLRKLAHLPADTRVIPGHGGDTTIGQEKAWLSRAQQMFS